jgi:TrmH family RNA methyltransferase
MLRTAHAAGVAGVILLGGESDPFDDRVVAASRGGVFGLQPVRTSHERFAAWTRRHGCQVIGTSPHATADYTTIDLSPPIVVMVGEERHGLTSRERELCTATVAIPMIGRADSLNVAVAAGIVLFDIRRRRGSPGR